MSEAAPRPDTLSALRRRLSRSAGPGSARRHPASSTVDALAELSARTRGCWVEGTAAPVRCVEERLPGDFQHGRGRLDALLESDPAALALISGERGERFEAQRALFLDTETTGLSGGAGTYAFLVGVGFFEKQTFCLRQYVLPGPASEKALLGELLQLIRLGGFRHLVTFNGKSYDVPLLDTRCVLHRLDRPWARLDHADVLYPGRTLWRGRFRDCSLQTLEARVLGVGRGADIPSARIPDSYFTFLRSGRFPLLPLILNHNRWDLLTLVRLCSVISRALRDPAAEPSVDAGRAAALLTRRARPAEALALLEKDAARRGDSDHSLQLAELHKKLGHYRRALDCYSSAITRRPDAPQTAFEEAAKLLEHRLRDLSGALEVVNRARRLFPECPDLEARRHRLQCRLAGRRWY